MMTLNFKQIIIFTCTSLFLMMSNTSFSQEKKKVLEISTYSFEQFSIRYKFGNEKHLFRISSFTLNASSSNVYHSEDPVGNFNVGLGFGIEFPKQINEKLSLYYGPELRGSFYIDNFTQNTRHYSVSIRGIFGFSYYFNEIISLGAEIDPGFSYNHDNDTDQTLEESFRFDFLNYGAAIVLGFTF